VRHRIVRSRGWGQKITIYKGPCLSLASEPNKYIFQLLRRLGKSPTMNELTSWTTLPSTKTSP
jgi:hypothetical protein